MWWMFGKYWSLVNTAPFLDGYFFSLRNVLWSVKRITKLPSHFWRTHVESNPNFTISPPHKWAVSSADMVTLSKALATLSAGEQLYARTSVLNDTVRLSVHHWHCHSNSISHSASFFLHPAQLSITTEGNSQPLDFFIVQFTGFILLCVCNVDLRSLGVCKLRKFSKQFYKSLTNVGKMLFTICISLNKQCVCVFFL